MSGVLIHHSALYSLHRVLTESGAWLQPVSLRNPPVSLSNIIKVAGVHSHIWFLMWVLELRSCNKHVNTEPSPQPLRILSVSESHPWVSGSQ